MDSLSQIGLLLPLELQWACAQELIDNSPGPCSWVKETTVCRYSLRRLCYKTSAYAGRDTVVETWGRFCLRAYTNEFLRKEQGRMSRPGVVQSKEGQTTNGYLHLKIVQKKAGVAEPIL